MYNNNNNDKSQQYLFEKTAGNQKGQTTLQIGSQGESSFLVVLFGNFNKRNTARLSKLFRVSL